MKVMVVFLVAFAVAGVFALKGMRGEVRPHHISFGSDLTYSVKDVQTLMRNPDAQVHRVISPQLFPFDLIFLICLGGFLALASLLIAPHTKFAALSICLLLTFPLLYMAFDFIENSLLAWMLRSHPESLTARFVLLVKTATLLKLGFVALSFLQVLYLAGLWIVRACRCS